LKRFPIRIPLVLAACLLAGGVGGALSGRRAGHDQAMDRSKMLPGTGIRCKPGPWGELTYTPFSIAAPDDMVPVRTLEALGTHWFFAGYTTDSFINLLQSTSLTPDQQHQLLGPDTFTVRSDGIELTPSPDMVFSLPHDALEKFYPILAQSPENDQELNFIPKDEVNGWFSVNHVSPQAMEMFRNLSCQRGEYLMFSGVAAVLSRLQSYDDKAHFTKALTQQRTLLLRLHLTPQTDVDALAKYWGIGCFHTDARTMLKSLAAIPQGTWMSIMMVLPDLPSAELYDYPSITDNPLNGPAVNRDCAWTSLNFFNEKPDPSFGTMDGVQKEISANYVPVTDSPRYGDLILFAKPDRYLVHAAIYIADDICFTKNGSTLMHPWMLSTIDEVTKHFAFEVDPNQKLTIRYFRKKQFL